MKRCQEECPLWRNLLVKTPENWQEKEMILTILIMKPMHGRKCVSRTRMSFAFWSVCCVETLLFLKFRFNFGKLNPMSGYQMLGHKLSVKDANYPKSLELDN